MPHERTQEHAVDVTLEYSRPFRALKLWLAFRAHGAAAFRAAIERNLRQARLLYDTVSAAPDMETLGELRSSRSCRSGMCPRGRPT